MDLQEILRDRKAAIVRRWVEEVLATYPREGLILFREQQDPFANPVGHSVRTGTDRIVTALLEEGGEADIQQGLHDIISIRAVQNIPPSRAVGFVLGLKAVIRSELGEAAAAAHLTADLQRLEARIDDLALAAFDIFTECRERIAQIRISEVKRQVSWVMEQLNRRGDRAESTAAEPM